MRVRRLIDREVEVEGSRDNVTSVTRRVASEQAVGVQPLFPSARILRSDVATIELELQQARREVESARRDATLLREETDREIAASIGAAARDADQIRLAAEVTGAANGRAKWESLVLDLDSSIQSLLTRVPIDVQHLAIAVARKVIEIEFALRPDAVVDLVRSVLSAAKLYREISVVVSPTDLDRVTAEAESLQQRLVAVERFSVRADPEVPPGGVRLETDRGVLDGSIETQLAVIADAMLAAPPTVETPGESP